MNRITLESGKRGGKPCIRGQGDCLCQICRRGGSELQAKAESRLIASRALALTKARFEQ